MATDKEKFIEFKAEVKLDLKYLREGSAKMEEGIKELTKKLEDLIQNLTKKVNKQCTEIAVLKTKVVIYAGLISGAVGIVVTFAVAFLKG